MSLALQIHRFWKHQSSRTWLKCLLFTFHIQELSRHREPDRSTILLGAWGSLKSQKSLTRAFMCYLCFWSTQGTMLPSLIYFYPSLHMLVTLTSKVDENKYIYVRVGEFLKVNKLLLQIMVKLLASDNEMNQILQFDKREV